MSVDEIIHRRPDAGLLIDANLLLLLVIGGWERREIRTFKRTNAYLESDFDLLMKVIRQFRGKFATTAGILAEVSNLAGQITGRKRAAAFAYFLSLIQTLEETHSPARDADAGLFVELGFTDSMIAKIGESGFVVLTDDATLWSRLLSIGVEAINFNHLREFE